VQGETKCVAPKNNFTTTKEHREIKLVTTGGIKKCFVTFLHLNVDSFYGSACVETLLSFLLDIVYNLFTKLNIVFCISAFNFSMLLAAARRIFNI
jgi:hypothetical protein